ncbi:MAG: class I tRNA ligase family protein, partial [Oscillospiraceae bacterium]
AAPWNTSSIKGCKRFLERIWNLSDMMNNEEGYSKKLEASFHKAIKKVTEDTEQLKFNTGIATLMALLNEIYEVKSITRGEMKTLLLLLNPFAPHITEEMWESCKFNGRIFQAPWPKFDENKCQDDIVEMVVQIMGKVRAKITVSSESTKEEIIALAKASPEISQLIGQKEIVKEIFVPSKLINFVIK